MKRWVDELKVKAPADLEIAIVGNKIDLCESEQISFAFAKEYASSIGAPLLLVSAK
jgi:GTPase SAR1 family protein